MPKFQDAYQDAVDALPKCHMEVEDVLDEAHHDGFAARLEKRSKAYKALNRVAAVVAGLFVVCGVGTVTAMNYQKSIIKVEDTGYSIVSQKVAETEVVAAEADAGMAVAEERNYRAEIAEEEKETIYQKFVEEITAEQDEARKMKDEVATDAEELYAVVKTEEPTSYASVEEFRRKENITVAIPGAELLGEVFEEKNIMVLDEGRYFSLMYHSPEKQFGLVQQDTRDYEQYASSTTYMGESENERNFVNEQGLTYVVFDTVENGEIQSTHAVISVNGRDLCLDFYGFEENVIEDVLKQLDLSIYFQD